MVTVALPAQPMLGAVVSDESLGKEHVQIWKKASGTVFTFGELVVIPKNATECVAATTGAVGRFGVVARLDDNYDAVTGRGDMNIDGSTQVVVLTDGARVYVKGSGGIKANSEVQAVSTGLIGQYVESAWTTATPDTFNLPLTEFERIVGIYEGHYGESLQSGGEPPTDATTGQENLILRLGGRYH